MDIDDIQDSQDEWTLVEGTQKRRMAKPRGRPRLSQRKDTTQGDIQSFLVQSQTTQKSIPTQDKDVDTITIAGTQ
jgi:hypothetical protein